MGYKRRVNAEFHWNQTKCSRSSSPPLSSPQLSLLDLPPTEPPLPTLLRSFPPSLMLTSTEWLMTTARPTSRRQKHKMPTVSSLVASWLLFLTAESRPPPTPLITSTDSSLMSPTRAPQSTPQSPRRDTATTPPPPTNLPLKKTNVD